MVEVGCDQLVGDRLGGGEGQLGQRRRGEPRVERDAGDGRPAVGGGLQPPLDLWAAQPGHHPAVLVPPGGVEQEHGVVGCDDAVFGVDDREWFPQSTRALQGQQHRLIIDHAAGILGPVDEGVREPTGAARGERLPREERCQRVGADVGGL